MKTLRLVVDSYEYSNNNDTFVPDDAPSNLITMISNKLVSGLVKHIYTNVPTLVYNRTHMLQWSPNDCDGISNHQPHDCLLNRCVQAQFKEYIKKLRFTGLCEGNSPVTGEFLSQRASNAENVSIWWRHHDMGSSVQVMACCLFSAKSSSKPVLIYPNYEPREIYSVETSWKFLLFH